MSSAGSPMLGMCPVFPPDNEWNRDISADPVDANSDKYLASMNAGAKNLHPDFGRMYGIPWITVPGTQPKVAMTFRYSDSDPGPYPFPPDAPIEGGPNSTGDRHILVVERDSCKLYEGYACYLMGAGWRCDSGAIFDLHSNKLRADGATSADAAGLPILAGLVRQAEIAAGEVKHAFRFTAARTQRGFVHPATHQAGSTDDPNFPPMGLRVRLKAGFDIAKYNRTTQVILTALKKYGMFLADNGSDWYITGDTNAMWNDDELNQLKTIPASAFEVVKLGPIIKK